jgi:hypothetical protein
MCWGIFRKCRYHSDSSGTARAYASGVSASRIISTVWPKAEYIACSRCRDDEPSTPTTTVPYSG